MTSHTNRLTSDAVTTQLGESYGHYGVEEQARHVELLQAVQQPEEVAVHVEGGADQHWTATICTADRVGALAAIAGLFTAHGFDIDSADIFTLDFSKPQGVVGKGGRQRRYSRRALANPGPPARMTLDIFQVVALGEARPDAWQRFREDLESLVALLVAGEQAEARDEIIEMVSNGLRRTDRPSVQPLPMGIEVDNDVSPAHTQLTIRSVDTPGFLFEFTNTVAALHVDIKLAKIRSFAGGTDDTFWVTGRNGKKITNAASIHDLRVAAALIKQFTYLLPQSPNPAQALRQFNSLTHLMLSRPDWRQRLRDLESSKVLEILAELMGVSQFLWEDFLRLQHENLFPVLDAQSLDHRMSREQLERALLGQMGGVTDHGELVKELNSVKDREMFRIDLRHITGRIEFSGFSEELTTLTEVIVGSGAELSHKALCESENMDERTLAEGLNSSWCICALGKFGGRELGFGSDMELVVLYETKSPDGTSASAENAQYFEEFVRTLTRTIKPQREGIFEIDLRLRPYGDKGPLASTPEGFRQYYSMGGAARQFERMSLVKLRPVAGDPELGARVEVRDAFVYSGIPLDMKNILHLRNRQASELVQAGSVNAKYSPGGLVDVEYFVQAQQIAVGHTDPNVRVTNTLDAIDQLARGGHISKQRTSELRETYGFLRQLIDALRGVRGHARDLAIPSVDSREFAYLTRRLKYESSLKLQRAIAIHMDTAGMLLR